MSIFDFECFIIDFVEFNFWFFYYGGVVLIYMMVKDVFDYYKFFEFFVLRLIVIELIYFDVRYKKV